MGAFILLFGSLTMPFTASAYQRYFMVHNKKLEPMNSTQFERKASSLLECAMLLSHGSYMSASFNNDTMMCRLSSETFPTTISKLESTVIQLQANDIPLYDCSDLSVNSVSGIYKITPNNEYRTINVYCEMTEASGGWTVVSRRFDGSVDFENGEWNNYKNGIGDLSGEFWLGNEHLHQITSRTRYQVRFDLTDFNGDTAHALYSTFGVASESTNYTLSIAGYSGTAGNSMSHTVIGSLNGSEFQTIDSGKRCPSFRRSGWWYWNCAKCNVLGIYQQGAYGEEYLTWKTWRDKNCLAKITTMIKPFP